MYSIIYMYVSQNPLQGTHFPLVLQPWQVIFDAGQVDILTSVMHCFT